MSGIASPSGEEFVLISGKKILLRKHKPAMLVEGSGIFICRKDMPTADGFRLILDCFAADVDLKFFPGNDGKLKNWLETKQAITEIRNYLGKSGSPIGFEGMVQLTQVAEAICRNNNGLFNTGWIIPPSEIFAGIDDNCAHFVTDSILRLKDSDTLKETLGSADQNSNPLQKDLAHCYWVCNLWSRQNPTGKRIKLDGTVQSEGNNALPANCRPVHVVAYLGKWAKSSPR